MSTPQIDLGIVCPLWAEAQPWIEAGENCVVFKKSKRSWVQMQWKGFSVMLVVSKPGAANAERGTQQLIERYQPSMVLNFGTAAGLGPKTQVGDWIFANQVIQCDESWSPEWYSASLEWLPPLKEYFPVAHEGVIVSGHHLISNSKLRQHLRKSHNAIAGDWESAAVIRTCFQQEVPAMVLRIISDHGTETAESDFHRNIGNLSKFFRSL